MGIYKDAGGLVLPDSSPSGVPAGTGAYDTYTPTLTATTTSPDLGTSPTVFGYWAQQGKRVWGYAGITFGSSPSAGEGAYGILLPAVPVNRNQPVGTGYLLDASDNVRAVLGAVGVSTFYFAAATAKAIIFVSNVATEGLGSGDNPVGAAVPWTWAEGDSVTIQFDYEAA